MRGLGVRAEPSGPARWGRRKVRWGLRSVRATRRRAAGPGPLRGLQPPPKLSGPAKVPGALREGRVQALLLPDLARPRRASVSRRWGRQRGSGLLPAVGESHSHDSARRLARWRGRRRRADPGPGLAPALESRRAAGEAERDFPGRGERAEEGLPSPA